MKREWEWRFRLSWLMRAVRGLSAEEKGNFLDDTIIALQARERGVNEFVDAILANADALSKRQADNAKGGLDTTASHGAPRQAMVRPTKTKTKTTLDKRNPNTKPRMEW